ncbi:hypothetical protein LEN26_015335 [Aphanomyces euteiches]|nr:hypothetical protein LEN26_015335 [Aphanomyces euteiches]KAH9126960.1 hypothetical protein AeMF1_002734 [Aphanomyces euteiches]KAH9193085.1 hypothetical protein AeNC1_004940 [Aphanomyces euteiches]
MPTTAKRVEAKAAPTSNQETEDFLAVLQKLNLSPPKASAPEASAFKFWRTQAVVGLHEPPPNDHGHFWIPVPASEVRGDPLKLPAGYMWCHLDLTNSSDAKDMYTLLSAHYCEDNGGRFRLDYSIDFLTWALTSPGHFPAWHVGVRHVATQRLMAFIGGTPKLIRAHHDIAPTCEINFLCIHKKLRNKRLAPVLIKEVSRRVKLENVWRAVYTGASLLPTPVATTQCYHRPLNTKKCIDVGFAHCPPNTPLTHMIKSLKLPETPQILGFQPLRAEHVPQVTALLRAHHASLDLAMEWTEADVAHWLLPRSGVVDSFVVVDPSTNQVTDCCSYYHLPMSVLNHPEHKTFRTAYSFYHVATSVPLVDLLVDLMVMAKNHDMDIFSAVNFMDLHGVLEPLQFVAGSGHLYYYLFNWRCPPMTPDKVGLVFH